MLPSPAVHNQHLHEQLSPPPSSVDQQGTRCVKLYEAWPGKNRPCCWGTCLVGVHWGNLLFNASLTVALVVLFCVFIGADIHWAIVAMAILLLLITEAFLLSAAFMDPGIIPRQPMNRELEEKRLAYEQHRERQITQETRRAIGLDRETTEQELLPPVAVGYSAPIQQVTSVDPLTGHHRVTDIPLKWCSTCHIYRPYSCSHCRECDHCVKGFDHHCPWISNCVGERNHRVFVGFIFSLTTLTVFVFVCSLYQLISVATGDGGIEFAVQQHVVALILVVFTFVVGWCFMSLSCYHCFLIQQQITTNQHIKQQRERRVGQQQTEQHNNIQASTQSQQQDIHRDNTQARSLEEGVVGVISGSAFTAGTTDDNESKSPSSHPSAPSQSSSSSPPSLYPPVVAHSLMNVGEHRTFFGAFWYFFCSPLPPSQLDLQREVIVNREGDLIAYSTNEQRA